MRAVERPGGVLEPGMCGHLLRGNRETLHLPFADVRIRMVNPMWARLWGWCTSVGRESDSFIVSEKPSNKMCDNKRMAEEVEKRRHAKGNLVEQNKGRTQCRETFVK